MRHGVALLRAHRGDLRRPRPRKRRKHPARNRPPVDEFRAAGPGVHRALRLDGQWGEGTVGDFLDNVPPGAVVVIDNDGRTDVTVWGHHDIAGTVINGVCRDVSASLSQNYPLFGRGRFMRTGKEQILKIRAAHGFAATYGSPRVWLELRRQGVRFGRKWVQRLRRSHGLWAPVCAAAGRAVRPGRTQPPPRPRTC